MAGELVREIYLGIAHLCRVSSGFSIAFLISVSVFFFKSYKNLNFPFGKWPNELQFLLVIFSFNGSYNRKDLKYIISKLSSLLTVIKDMKT